LRINPRSNYQMATCDTLEVDLSRVDVDITLEQYPCIDVEVLQPDIVIDIGTVANQGPKGDKGDQGVAGPPGQQGVAGPPGGQGLPGNAATVDVGATVTGIPGSNASVTNSGSTSAAVFNFSIPRGDVGATGATGAQGAQGAAATVTAGTTTTGAPGSNASVTNSGSSSAAVFNFTIPRGDVGPVGPQGPSGSGTGDMLKSVYDTNSNNIVDAAESVPWTGVTGKPATFPPSAHASTHLSAGSDPIAIATSVLAGLCPAVDNTTIQVVASKLSAVSLAWTAITGRPSTFPPDSTAMLKSVYDTNADNIVDHAALADTTPWTGITGVPATFAPSAHQASHVTGTDQIPSAGISARGLMAQANNNPNAFYASDATQKQVTYAMLGGSQPGPIAHASTHVTGGTDVIVPASASTAGLLKQLSGNTTDFVDGTNACQNLVAAIQPTIWSVRLRSINAAGNSTMECDQINIGNTVANATGKIIDRWVISKSGTMVVSAGQVSAAAGDVLVPNTSFCITRSFFRVTLTTAQASLAASDTLTISQLVEGPLFRELQYDVHSLQVLVRSSVAGLKFGLCVKDANTRALIKLCTIPSSATWTLITLPNLPVWPSAGAFSSAPGVNGYQLIITLAAGTTVTSPANDTWQNGNYWGAVGQSNFASNAVNSTFDIAFIQHEPGSQCSTLIDCPFTQNYDACLRYLQKSFTYTDKPGVVNAPSSIMTVTPANGTTLALGAQFKKPMAKIPTVTIYNASTGAANSVWTGASIAVSSVSNIGDSGFGWITLASASTAGNYCNYHYVADSGW
jgi:hypothetical protein